MPEPKRTIGEFLLAHAVGGAPAAAIYGDLVEMAAARGRVWFWVAYARTLIALTWRTPAAFVAGVFVLAAVFWLQMGVLSRTVLLLHFPQTWRHVPHGQEGLTVYAYFFQGLYLANFGLCFLAAYAAVRYGLRDRMVRAALGLGLMLTGAETLVRVWPAALSLVALAVLMTAGSLFFPEWRGAFASVAATTAAGAATLYCLLPVARLGVWYFAHHGPSRPARLLFYVFLPTTWGIVIVDMLLLAAVSSWLHRRLVGEDAVVAGG